MTQQETAGPPAPWHKRAWAQNLFFGLGALALVYAMVYADVVLRAREAYLEGEKYMRWHERPEAKRAELEAEFQKAKQDLDKKLAGNKIPKDEHERLLEIAGFDRDHALEESSLKYAVVWYQTAYELFSPPESKWVRLAREKAPLAKEKWKAELRSQNVPFEDYMLD